VLLDGTEDPENWDLEPDLAAAATPVHTVAGRNLMKTRMRMTIAASVGAVVIAAGSGAAALASPGSAAAATQTPAASGFTWHPLHLINGWTALSAPVYGRPSYAVRDGVLYLSGILQAPKSGAPEFAVLPQGARPTHYLWLSYMNFGADNLGEMEIEPSGEMFAYGTTNGSPPVDPSLAAISFPLSS